MPANPTDSKTLAETAPGYLPRHRVRQLTLALTACLLVLGVATLGSLVDGLPETPLPVEEFALFDLGVTDIDSDGRLDVYSVNHSSPQSLLMNLGRGSFQQAPDHMGLHQTRDLPGLASVARPPQPVPDSLAINWIGPELIVSAHGLDAGASGVIQLSVPVEVVRDSTTRTTVARDSDGGTRILFGLSGDQAIVLSPEVKAVPIRFQIHGLEPERIRVGPLGVSPASTDFVMTLRDRHGIAWFDYDSDGDLDAYVSRGGLQGSMDGGMPFWDELLLAEADGYHEIGREASLEKAGCPGRRTAMVDYDNDGLLDIYVVCGGGHGARPNQLFRRNRGPGFTEVAAVAGIDMPEDGSFVWIDADLDGDMDLLWASQTAVTLYRNDEGRFTPTVVDGHRRPAASALTVADYDNDGNLDVFLASLSGNLLLRSVEGGFRAELPERLALPAVSLAAAWVDYDNDGDQDLHLVPQGVFERRDGSFHATGRLTQKAHYFSLYEPSAGAVTWFDMDEDGDRDAVYFVESHRRDRRWINWLLTAAGWVHREPPPTHRETRLVTNGLAQGSWLEIDLRGRAGNRQAIGGRVELTAGGVTQVQQVGGAEGAARSQGHYRLYFGLEDAPQVEVLRVIWPDGTTDELGPVGTNQRLAIEQADRLS